MASLQPRYLERSAARIADVTALLAEGACLRNDDLVAIRMVFHDFAGTAGSLGFTEIGEEARKADDLILAMRRSEVDLNTVNIGLLREHAARVSAMIEKERR